MVPLFTFRVFSILAVHCQAWTSQRVQSPAATRAEGIKENQRLQLITLHSSRISLVNVNTSATLYAHHTCVWNVVLNGHWNDKSHKAKKPTVTIHLLRSVGYTLKLLKWTAPREETRSQGNEQSNLSKPPTGTFLYPEIQETQTRANVWFYGTHSNFIRSDWSQSEVFWYLFFSLLAAWVRGNRRWLCGVMKLAGNPPKKRGPAALCLSAGWASTPAVVLLRPHHPLALSRHT